MIIESIDEKVTKLSKECQELQAPLKALASDQCLLHLRYGFTRCLYSRDKYCAYESMN